MDYASFPLGSQMKSTAPTPVIVFVLLASRRMDFAETRANTDFTDFTDYKSPTPISQMTQIVICGFPEKRICVTRVICVGLCNLCHL